MGFCFGHLHFSDHEKWRCPKQAKAHTEKDASYRFLLEQYLASENLEIRPFLEIGNTEFIVRLLKEGQGLSLIHS